MLHLVFAYNSTVITYMYNVHIHLRTYFYTKHTVYSVKLFSPILISTEATFNHIGSQTQVNMYTETHIHTYECTHTHLINQIIADIWYVFQQLAKQHWRRLLHQLTAVARSSAFTRTSLHCCARNSAQYTCVSVPVGQMRSTTEPYIMNTFGTRNFVPYYKEVFLIQGVRNALTKHLGPQNLSSIMRVICTVSFKQGLLLKL